MQADESSADDSFLDVIANVVGVLIILVMLVGIRASTTIARPASPASLQAAQLTELETTPPPKDLTPLRAELDEARRQAIASQREIQEMAVRVVKISQDSALQDQHRVELAMHRAILDKDLQQRRSKLDSRRQQEFDVQRELVEAKIKLDEMTKEQLALAATRPTVEQIESVPTPLAKTIEEEAIHLRIQKGLVSIVPLEELLQEVQYHVEDFRRRLQSHDVVVETFGPLGGYRLRFTITKRNAGGSIVGPQVGQLQRIVHGQFAQVLPASDEMGQNVEQALMPGSELYQLLHASKRKPPPVVVWLYTDSFNEFRPLKRALWEMGVSVAVRPMRPGTLIGASPQGSKSSAQ